MLYQLAMFSKYVIALKHFSLKVFAFMFIYTRYHLLVTVSHLIHFQCVFYSHEKIFKTFFVYHFNGVSLFYSQFYQSIHKNSFIQMCFHILYIISIPPPVILTFITNKKGFLCIFQQSKQGKPYTFTHIYCEEERVCNFSGGFSIRYASGLEKKLSLKYPLPNHVVTKRHLIFSSSC